MIQCSHMRLAKKEEEEFQGENSEVMPPKVSSGEQEQQQATKHLAFQKNYPKNIFIPLIEHLSQMGLQKEYQECVGTRESFQGKNVVSLAEIHKVLSQEWFEKRINLVGLTSNMSNKILMNSKIKKKLFHLLLIRDLLLVPRQDAREFKKMVSKIANDVPQSRLPNDPLFAYPSALIYLLSLFTQTLSGTENLQKDRFLREALPSDDKTKKYFNNQETIDKPLRQKDLSSKQEYKNYISRIISALNSFQGDPAELLDMLEHLKMQILSREKELREKYKLPLFVPEWSYFNSIVINNCYSFKRNRQKLTFSLFNQWIQDFKDKSTSLKGFLELTAEEQQPRFQPIVLVYPPL